MFLISSRYGAQFQLPPSHEGELGRAGNRVRCVYFNSRPRMRANVFADGTDRVTVISTPALA